MGEALRLMGLILREDYDAVPVVGVVNLGVAALGLDDDAVLGDAVAFEGCCHVVGALLRELHVVVGCAGVLVSIAGYDDLLVGVGLHPLCHVVYVDHFLVGDLGRIDGEAYGGHQRGVVGTFHCLCLGAGELCLGGCELATASCELAAEVVDLTVKLVDVREIVAGIVGRELGAGEADGETAYYRDVHVHGVAVSLVVEVVACE